MGRYYHVAGEVIVLVSNAAIGTRQELGICSDSALIRLRHHHKEIHIDNYGGIVPVDVAAMLTDAIIVTELIHYDEDLMRVCWGESSGGINIPPGPDGEFDLHEVLDGTLTSAGTLLGNNAELGAAGNHFITLELVPANAVGVGETIELGEDEITLASANPPLAWRFFASYLGMEPSDIKMGTKATNPHLVWRAIPYQRRSSASDNDLLSSRAPLYDHPTDYPTPGDWES